MKHPSEEVTKKFINGLAAMGITYDEDLPRDQDQVPGIGRLTYLKFKLI